jgi:hypothetical protein
MVWMILDTCSKQVRDKPDLVILVQHQERDTDRDPLVEIYLNTGITSHVKHALHSSDLRFKRVVTPPQSVTGETCPLRRTN